MSYMGDGKNCEEGNSNNTKAKSHVTDAGQVPCINECIENIEKMVYQIVTSTMVLQAGLFGDTCKNDDTESCWNKEPLYMLNKLLFISNKLTSVNDSLAKINRDLIGR